MEVKHANTFTMEQIAKAVEAMAKAQERSATSIARVIVMAAWQANAEKKADVANMLMKNLRKGVKKDAIVALLQEKANLAYVSGAFQFFDAGHAWTEDEAKGVKVAAATWESYRKAPEAPKAVDVLEALDELVQKLMKRSAKGELTNAEFLPKLQAVLGEAKAAELFA